jgi:hypothetical protein
MKGWGVDERASKISDDNAAGNAHEIGVDDREESLAIDVVNDRRSPT